MKYFGTDGIRGIPNKTLTVDLAYKLGKALSLLPSKVVVIGSDTRVSKDMFQMAIASGAMAMGLDVIFAGVIPTPSLIFCSERRKITGIMITASHNPYTDNGIKVLSNGRKLSEQEEENIESFLDGECTLCPNVGKIITSNVLDEYLDFVNNLNIHSHLRVSIDLANGATVSTAPLLYRSACEYLHVLANSPDGYNINDGVGSTHLDYLLNSVKSSSSDVGFAFDGDGDRVLACDSEGRIFDGDLLIYVIACYLHDKGLLNKDTVVFTIMSNLGLLNALKKKGINVVTTPVGDKYVVREMDENEYSIGGENSGHIILRSILPTGDGVLVSLFILKIMEETHKTLYELTKDIIMYPDKMVNLRVSNKALVLNDKNIINRVECIKQELGSKGKVILRASGTEDLIRVSVSAETEDVMNKYLNELVNMVSVYKEAL